MSCGAGWPCIGTVALLRRLSESRSPPVRSTAAVTLAKLTGPSKAFTSPGGAKGADEVIGSTLELLAATAGLPPPSLRRVVGGSAEAALI